MLSYDATRFSSLLFTFEFFFQWKHLLLFIFKNKTREHYNYLHFYGTWRVSTRLTRAAKRNLWSQNTPPLRQLWGGICDNPMIFNSYTSYIYDYKRERKENILKQQFRIVRSTCVVFLLATSSCEYFKIRSVMRKSIEKQKGCVSY